MVRFGQGYVLRVLSRLYVVAVLVCAMLPALSVAAVPSYRVLPPVKANLYYPTAVAVGPDERIYVAESSLDRLVVFGSDGRHQLTMGGLDMPTSVTAGPGGLFYVGNAGRGNVEIYSNDFALIGELGQGFGEFSQPTGIAVDSDGNVYVADGETNSIKVYLSDFTFSFSFGSKGVANGQFQMPTSIAINEATSELYITDLAVAFSWTGGAARVQVFGLDGAFKRSFKTENGSGAPYIRPLGVAVDEIGRIYVSDSYQSVVAVYSSQGSYLGKIVEPTHPLLNPMGMAYAPGTNRLFVASLNSASVETYGIEAQYSDINLTPSSHDFGELDVGSVSDVQAFDISSNGDGDLVIGTVFLSGADTNDFSFLSDNCSDQTLVAGDSCRVEVTFSPTSGGEKSAVLSMPSNDIYEPVASAALGGIGLVPQYTLAVTKDGIGSGSVHGPGVSCGAVCAKNYDVGSQVTLIAIPQVGSQFDGWSGGGCSGTGSCVVTLNGDVGVTAVFTQAPVATYTVNASAGIGGSISPVGETVAIAGSSINYTITPEAGYHITDVLVDGASGGTRSTFSFVDISADHTITARFETDRVLPSLIEVGVVAVNSNWQRVTFNKSFVDPIVVAKPASHNDIDPGVVRLRNVNATGFEVRVQEWNYQDGLHAEEHISYIVMEKGAYVVPGGALIVAGRFETSNVSAFGAVEFNRSFNVAPVVVASVMTSHEEDAVTGRLKNINTSSFEYRMQEQEANNELHAVETIGYIAWEPSMGALDGLVFEVGKSAEIISHSFTRLDFEAPHLTMPAFIADMQTMNEDDPANLRWRNKSLYGADIQVDEEQSADAESGHNPERVGYLVFSGSVTGVLADTDNDGLPDSYENQYDFLDPLIPSDAQLDQDGDRVSNLEEYLHGTAPDDDLDTDGDGLSDKYESDNGLDPLDNSDCPEWICSRSYRGWRYAIP